MHKAVNYGLLPQLFSVINCRYGSFSEVADVTVNKSDHSLFGVLAEQVFKTFEQTVEYTLGYLKSQNRLRIMCL